MAFEPSSPPTPTATGHAPLCLTLYGVYIVYPTSVYYVSNCLQSSRSVLYLLQATFAASSRQDMDQR